MYVCMYVCMYVYKYLLYICSYIYIYIIYIYIYIYIYYTWKSNGRLFSYFLFASYQVIKYILSSLVQPRPPVFVIALGLWLNGWMCHHTRSTLLFCFNNIMDVNLLSLCTLAPAALCLVFYATWDQIYRSTEGL